MAGRPNPMPNEKAEDGLELFLKMTELCGKTVSFIVPSVYKVHGDFLAEVLYACGNFAATIRKYYHSGLLLKTLSGNTVEFIKKFVEVFEVVLECCAYKFGSKQIKWTSILFLQGFKLLLRLYLIKVRGQVLNDTCQSTTARQCRCPKLAGAASSTCQNRPRLAELLYSARPLLHTCLYVCQGPAAWLPWAASAGLDLLSLACLPSPACLTQRQRDCRSARLKSLALVYAFRTPAHDSCVQPIVAWLAEIPLPLVRSFFKLVLNYMIYWRLHYMNMWS
ncbi:hypothetical protein BOX15_Mlig028469g2 [Macrostomum lignano]|uniref:Peroxisomal membrane protein PEX16 n=1 Tax=Macrostomum lignano TaxID=282301 RepID=A0A267FZ96_9PLAT|nr:hypothetical protein BOX15_Mlig028469g2 [Macrostomum lignano]